MPTEDLVLVKLGDKFTTTNQAASEWALFTELTESDILKIKDKDGFSNLERIYYQNSYDTQEELRVDFDQRFLKLDTEASIDWPHPYVVGTIILVPKDKINRAVAARDGGSKQLARDPNYVAIGDSAKFQAEEAEKIVTNGGYRKVIIGEHGDGYNFVKKEVPSVQVYLWCRGLKDGVNDSRVGSKIQKPGSDQELDSDGLYGRWIDISRYVVNANISTDSNGGNFNIVLPPVQGLYSTETQSWEVDPSTLREQGSTIVGQSSLFERDSVGRPQRTEFYFKNAISANDLIFISFEPLAYEGEDRLESGQKGDNILRPENISPSRGQWDMIGLVDSVNQSAVAGSNDITITVSGRDLSKLIIEDGSYLFPLLFDEHNWVHKGSRLLQRNIFTNEYNFFAEPRYRTVEQAVQTIINVASNIRVIPDNVAEQAGGTSEGFKERRLEKLSPNEKVAEGLFIEAKKYVTKLRESNLPADVMSSIIPADVIEIQVLEKLITFLEPIVLGNPDNTTLEIRYKDWYAVIQTETGIPSPANGTEVEENYRGAILEGVLNDSDTNSDTLELLKFAHDYITVRDSAHESVEIIDSVGGGVWRWVKLIFDESIRNRRLADVSLGRPDGSLINLIWTYAQAPWIEFSVDTWGNNFYFTFRTPPWTKKIIREQLAAGWIDNVVVEGVDILQESLDFDTECYSTYQIDYKAGSFGTSSQLMSVIPTIPFPELAEIWGNKRLRVATNMLPFSDVEDVNAPQNRSYLRGAGIDDLIFAVDINIYKPFTRKGTIVLNGDRRLKKNTWFHYKPTNEIFYITGVSNNYASSQVDRTTTITVERGMVLDYVNGGTTIDVDGRREEISYFNIINSEKISQRLKELLNTDGEQAEEENSTATYEDGGSIFRVNRPVLDFFLQKRQFGRDKVVIND